MPQVINPDGSSSPFSLAAGQGFLVNYVSVGLWTPPRLPGWSMSVLPNSRPAGP